MGFLLDKCSFSPLDEEVIAGCRLWRFLLVLQKMLQFWVGLDALQLVGDNLPHIRLDAVVSFLPTAHVFKRSCLPCPVWQKHGKTV